MLVFFMDAACWFAMWCRNSYFAGAGRPRLGPQSQFPRGALMGVPVRISEPWRVNRASPFHGNHGFHNAKRIVLDLFQIDGHNLCKRYSPGAVRPLALHSVIFEDARWWLAMCRRKLYFTGAARRRSEPLSQFPRGVLGAHHWGSRSTGVST